MKLKKLIMKAFGAYGNETVVDFDDINSGLYLIRGNTGSGKTTIFDAIVFALYGESSGGRRTLAMMHSDYVDFSVPTEIELTFEHNGGTHTVSRKQSFTHHKDGSYSPQSPKAVFIESGKPAIENSTTVTARISELLGLNAGQFSQIVMLAQGDFRKFLEANSEGRCRILSKIFDTTKYKAVAERLDKARYKLERSRARDEESARLLIQNMILPDDTPDETIAKLKPVDPGDGRVLRSPTFEDDLAAWITEERKTAEELESRKKVCAAEREKLMEEKKAAEHQNKRLDDLEALRRQFEEQKSQAGIMDERLVKHKKGVHALAVRIEEEKLKNAETAAHETKVRLDGLVRLERECMKIAHEAGLAADNCVEDRAAAEILGNQLAQLRETLPDYLRLSEVTDNLHKQECEVRLRREESDSHKALFVELSSRLEAASLDLSGLSEVDAEAERTRTARIEAENVYRSFCEISQSIELAKRDASLLAENKAKLIELGKEALSRYEEYDRIYHLFIGNQAAVLATELHKEIEDNGEARCPVCGVLHVRGADSIPCPFKTMEVSCTQNDVDKAKSEADESEQKRQQLEIDVKSADALLQRKHDQIVDIARGLPDCNDIVWNELENSVTLSKLENEYKEAVGRCRQEEHTALEKRSHRNSLQALVADLTGKRQSEDDLERKAKERLSHAIAQCSGLRAVIDELRGRLAFADEKEAKAEISKRELALNEVKSKISAIEHAKSEADLKYAETQAKRTSAAGELERAEAVRKDCNTNFVSALEREGYISEEAYKSDAALIPHGTADAQRMLTQLAKEDAAYRENCRNTAHQLSDLEKETETFVRRDLNDLTNSYEESKQREKDAVDKYAAYVSIIDSQHVVLDRIAEITGRLRGTDAARDRLNSLARLATGEQGGGLDRLDFERFMLGDCLREVLYQANVRLDKMSGGRYELVHRSSGRDGRSVAGLDIDVLDHNTGRQRLAETISGGEGFQASMSLALGLADVVRNRAGNVQLDSTFIDEGFGTLDEEVLRKCLDVLKDLANGDRQVGIISHVPELELNVWPQIAVTSDDKAGSSVRIEKR